MKVFLDSNVAVAVFMWPDGVYTELYQLAREKHEIVVSEVVITEAKRVLADTFQVPEEDVALFARELQDNHVAGRPDTPYDVTLRDDDPDDPLILASAVAADADVLITGDKAFRAVDEDVPELLIRTPREFLDAEADG
jgi:putative PIN family toxin of toxin-antitoxin system